MKFVWEHIRDCLKGKGFRFRNLSKETELLSGIERQNNRFFGSFLLIENQLIQRSETDQVIEKLASEDGAKIVCIHGNAGEGKSGVLYGIAQYFSNHSIPFLAIRLDKSRPEKDSQYFGQEQCRLLSSPATCLGALADGRRAVLILDQLDAIRWSSSHSSDAWDVCKENDRRSFSISKFASSPSLSNI